MRPGGRNRLSQMRSSHRLGLSLAIAAGLAVAGLSQAQTVAVPGPAPSAPAAPATMSSPGPTEAAPEVAPVETPAAKPAATDAPATTTKAPEVPTKRARYDVAVIQALDKVTAESVRFEAAVGKPVRYKTLIFTVKACERSASEEAMEDSMVYMIVDSQPRAAPGKPTPPARQSFRGWMYASSPGLNPLQHPVYDAWLITCRAAAPPKSGIR